MACTLMGYCMEKLHPSVTALELALAQILF